MMGQLIIAAAVVAVSIAAACLIGPALRRARQRTRAVRPWEGRR